MNTLEPILTLYNGDPERWTQYTLARNSEGISVRPYHIDACSWCLHGGSMKVSNDNLWHILQAPIYLELQRRVNKWYGLDGEYRVTISEWNDAFDRTFEEVIELLSQEDVKDEEIR